MSVGEDEKPERLKKKAEKGPKGIGKQGSWWENLGKMLLIEPEWQMISE